MISYLEEPHVAISWDEESHFVYVRRTAYSYGEQYRSFMEKIVKILEQNKANKILLDSRELRVIAQEDQQWVSEYWIPRTLAAGLKYHAFLVPKSALAQSSLSRISTQFHNLNVETAYFSELEEARAWLNSKK